MLEFFKAWLVGLREQKSNPRSDAPATAPSLSDGAPTRFAQDYNGFALALYEQLAQRPGNVFFSPLSVRVACAMACAGASGETGVQMRNVLRLSSADSTGQSAFGKLISRLGIDGNKYEINLANALWSQIGEPLENEFIELLSRVYSGNINAVDFRSGAFEAVRKEINRWVKTQTKERIQQLLPPNGLSEDTRLVLVNAIYFKGSWSKPFYKGSTCDELFFPQSGTPVSVPLMHNATETRYMYAPGFQAVDLDYEGGDLAMLVLLPEKNKLENLEAQLSTSMLDKCVRNLTKRKVKIYLPRFKMTHGSELSSQLRELGMPLAFTGGIADFSGINGHKPPHLDSLFISSVFHQAKIEVNEEGTEAVAATAIRAAALHLPRRPPEVPVFRADHPFLFAIREKESGAILFLGRMDNPERDG